MASGTTIPKQSLYQLLPTITTCHRYDAGKVELDGSVYAGFTLPFDITQLLWIEAILVGGAEVYRNSELDPELRIYPGKQLAFLR